MANPQSRQRLYDALNKRGFDVGTFETFNTKMDSPDSRKRLYDAVGSRGFDLGDYSVFEQKIGRETTAPPVQQAPAPPSRGQYSGNVFDALNAVLTKTLAPVREAASVVGEGVSQFGVGRGPQATSRFNPVAGAANIVAGAGGLAAAPLTMADATMRQVPGGDYLAGGLMAPFQLAAEGVNAIAPPGSGETSQALNRLNQLAAQIAVGGGMAKSVPQIGPKPMPSGPPFIRRDAAKVPEVSTEGTLPPAQVAEVGIPLAFRAEMVKKLGPETETAWGKVKDLSDADLTRAYQKAGLDQPAPLSEAPVSMGGDMSVRGPANEAQIANIGALPKVRIEKKGDVFRVLDENGKEIGAVTDVKVSGNYVSIYPGLDVKNAGYGQATYLEMAKMFPGKRIISGDMSPYAENMWEALHRKGLAEKEVSGDQVQYVLRPANQQQIASQGAVPPATTPPAPPATATPQAAPSATPSTVTPRSGPGELWTRIRETVEDDWVRVKQLLKETDSAIQSDRDPYLRKELMSGRLGQRQGALQESVSKIDADVVATSKRLGLPDAELTQTVNEYLRAVHAPERNAILGDGAAGIRTQAAQALKQQIESSPRGAEVQRIAAQVKDLNSKGLDILRDSGLITPELHAKLRQDYPNHVPLNRIMDEANLNEYFSSEGFDVKGSGLRRAKGSDRPVSDILGNVAENLAKIQIRAEKNIVDRAVWDWANANPQLGAFEVVPRKAIGKTFSGQPIFKQVNDPNVLHLMVDGKPAMLRIKDPQVATAIRGVGTEYMPKLGGFASIIPKFTRLYSNLTTAKNPEFWLSNKIRDLQELAPTVAAQGEMGFSGAAKTIARDPASVKAVFDAVRGKDTPDTRLYRQMQADGGTTGGMALSTKQQVEVSIEKIRELNRSKPRQAAQAAVKFIDDINTIFEDSSRLSVYKTALDKGMSRDRAAFLAKNSTINFNRRGTGTPIINALYMFSNASIQGSAKMLRAMRNPKVAGAVVGGMSASLAAVNTYNDSVDPEWRTKVTKGDRMNNLIVMLASEDGSANYIKVPISWGLKSVKSIIESGLDAVVGKGEDAATVASRVASSIIDGYNPLGGSDIISAITPTIADVPIDIARNKRWSGGMIRPHDYGNKPVSELAFKNFGRTPIESAAKDVTSAMSDMGVEMSPADLAYAVEQYIGGSGRFAGKTISTIKSIGGEAPNSRDIPFVSRFYTQRSSEEVAAQIARQNQKSGQSSGIPSIPRLPTPRMPN